MQCFQFLKRLIRINVVECQTLTKTEETFKAEKIFFHEISGECLMRWQKQQWIPTVQHKPIIKRNKRNVFFYNFLQCFQFLKRLIRINVVECQTLTKTEETFKAEKIFFHEISGECLMRWQKQQWIPTVQHKPIIKRNKRNVFFYNFLQ